MTLQLSTDFVVGLVLGAAVGLMVGFLLGMVSSLKKRKLGGKKSRAQKLFNLAMQEENGTKQLKLLAQIVDKHPHSEWADKALEQAMKSRKKA